MSERRWRGRAEGPGRGATGDGYPLATQEEARHLRNYLSDGSGLEFTAWCCTQPDQALCWSKGLDRPAELIDAYGGPHDWAWCCFGSRTQRPDRGAP